MKCPKCDGKLVVTDITHTPDNKTLRRKRCVACANAIRTVEYVIRIDEIADFEENFSSYHRNVARREKMRRENL